MGKKGCKNPNYTFTSFRSIIIDNLSKWKYQKELVKSHKNY